MCLTSLAAAEGVFPCTASTVACSTWSATALQLKGSWRADGMAPMALLRAATCTARGAQEWQQWGTKDTHLCCLTWPLWPPPLKTPWATPGCTMKLLLI